jgi:hypothetical protein
MRYALRRVRGGTAAAAAGNAHVQVPSVQVPWSPHQFGSVTQMSMSQRAPE